MEKSDREEDSHNFARLLRGYTRSMQLTYAQLAQAAGLSFDTTRNWLRGVSQPRAWQDVVRLAQALGLGVAASDRLLRSAAHPDLAHLLRENPEAKLLSPWRSPTEAQAAPLPASVVTGPGSVEEIATSGQTTPTVLVSDAQVDVYNYPGRGGDVSVNYYQSTPTKLLPVSHAVPSVGRVVGRERELEELAQYLAANTTLSIVRGRAAATLFGVAGIGKSTLAAMYYHRYQQRYAKVYWRNLARDPYIGGVVNTIAESLGITFDPREVPDEDNQAMLLITWLRELREPYLLILDDCEIVLDDEGSAGPGWRMLFAEDDLGSTKLLLTSRHHIRAGRKQVHSYEIEGLSEADGIALLRLWGLAGYSETILKQAVAKCQGHPLALILLAQLAVEDNRELEGLLGEQRLWEAEVATNLLDEVYQRLPVEEQQLVCYLSLFDHPPYFSQAVTPKDVADILLSYRRMRHIERVRSGQEEAALLRRKQQYAWGWRPQDIAAHALKLSRRALLHPEGGRYTMHAVVREYAYPQLRDQAGHHRAAADYFQRLYQRDPLTSPPTQIGEVASLLNSFDHFCAGEGYEDAARLLMGTVLGYLQGENKVSLSDLLDRWSEFRRLASMTERLAGVPADRLSAKDRASALGNLGNAYRNLGEYGQAIRCYEQVLRVAEETSDTQLEGRARGNLGIVFVSLGEYARALDHYQQVLSIANQVGDTRMLGLVVGDIGLVYANMGDYEQAIDYYQQALNLDEQVGDLQGKSTDLSNLGNVYRALGKYQDALACHQEALSLAERLGDLQGRSNVLGNLGTIYAVLGDYGQAATCYREALTIAEQIGDRAASADHLGNLGNIFFFQKEYEQAVRYYQEALLLDEQLGDTPTKGTNLSNLGSALLAMGAYPQAARCQLQALIIAEQIGDQFGQGSAWNNLGVVNEVLQDYQSALACYQLAHSRYKELGNQDHLVKVERNIERVRIRVPARKWRTLTRQADKLISTPGWRPALLEQGE